MPRTTTVDAAGCPAGLRAVCCDALGFVKVVQPRCENGAENGPLDVVARWGKPGDGISVMSYSSSSNRLALARKSGAIEVLDSNDGSICSQLASLKLDDSRNDGGICGLHLFRQDSTSGQAVLSCDKGGLATMQTIGDENAAASRWNVCKSGDVLSMTVHNNENIASFGGDRVELSLWDLESNSKIWEAKKPRPNRIGLVSFPYVTASTFLLKDDHRKLVIGTGDYQVRLYDIDAQKRPVIAVTYEESPIKAVAEDPDGYTVYVGNATGSLASFDMRTGKLLAGFKGKLAGSVRSIVRHPTLRLIASCGLDRFLRVHDIRSRQLLGRIFLKQPLVGVDFADLVLSPNKTEQLLLTESKAVPQGKRKKAEEEEYTEEEQRIESENGDENEGVEDKPRKNKKAKKNKNKQPKRKQVEDGDEATNLSEDESPKKKRKELKKLKRKQNGEQQQQDEDAEISKTKKKKKFQQQSQQQSDIESSKSTKNRSSTKKKKRAREDREQV